MCPTSIGCYPPAVTCTDCTGLSPLCATCLARTIGWLAGAAGARGNRWADKVVRTLTARRIPEPWPPWPDYDASERVRRMATARVIEVYQDPRVTEALARACCKSAAWRYEQLIHDEEARSLAIRAPPRRR